MSTPGRTTRKQTRDGFILVAVLWMLAALATLATIYAVYVINTATALGINDDRLQAEALTRAGLELTAHQILATPTAPPAAPPAATPGAAPAAPPAATPGAPPAAPLPAGGFSFRLGRANVGVEFRSEAGRIDLNMASKELLSGLFASFGARSDIAERFADRIIAWRTAPNERDTEASDYRTAGRRYPPRGGRFPHVEELSLVLGFPAELVERVLPFLTVYSGRAEVNVLVADPQVIAALPGMTPDRVYAILAQRQVLNPDLQAIKAMLGPADRFATTEANRSFRVNVRMQFDNGRQASSEVVIFIPEDGVEPYAILSWRDDLDEPAADFSRGTGLR